MDPSDDCTFWYVGDYLKNGAGSYSTRIGAFRLPGCGGSSTPRLAKWMWWRSRSKGKGSFVKK